MNKQSGKTRGSNNKSRNSKKTVIVENITDNTVETNNVETLKQSQQIVISYLGDNKVISDADNSSDNKQSSISESILPPNIEVNNDLNNVIDIGKKMLSDLEFSVLDVLSFCLDNEEYAIDVSIIKEIIKATELTFIPRTPDYIKGIISLRGIIIPIYDLRNKLFSVNNNTSVMYSDIPKIQNTNVNNNIIIVSLEKGFIGIIVDSVNEVIELDSSLIEPPPQVIAESDSTHLKGISRHKGRLIILLSLERLFEEFGK